MLQCPAQDGLRGIAATFAGDAVYDGVRQHRILLQAVEQPLGPQRAVPLHRHTSRQSGHFHQVS